MSRCDLLYMRAAAVLATVVLAYAQGFVFPGSSKGDINDSCVLPSGATGTCRLITSCPMVLQSLAYQRPKICSFQGRNPIVCCPGPRDPIRITDISPPTTDFDCGQNFELSGNAARLRRNTALQGAPSSLDINVIHNIEGVESTRNAWPWMALLGGDRGVSRVWFCGGVLINRRWVLTAAHCTNIFNTTVVRLGEHDFTKEDDVKHEDVGVAEVVFHPGFKHPEGYHDIALIRLAKQINLRREVSPVCLPWGHEADLPLEGNTVTVTGWGSTRYFRDVLSNFLNEINVIVFATDVCASSYSTLVDYSFNYPQGMGEETLCIGDNSNNERIKDSCEGDSGGPAVVLRKGRYTTVGIVSKGFGCGKKGFPGIYVKVQYPEHLAWIKKVAFSNT